MLEITLLKLLRSRERMERLGRFVPKAALDVRTQTIIADMQAYLSESGVPEVTIDPFYVWFCLRHPTLNTEQQELYKALLTRALTEPVDPETERGILGRLVQAEAASSITDVITRWNEGAEINLYSALRQQVESLEEGLNTKADIPEVTDSMDDILLEDINDAGLKWRLKGLNDVLWPLRGGDFLIYAGRVGKGKTTGVMSEVSFMAKQFEAYYGPNHGRYVVWLCNEGPGKRIVNRAYQSVLNATQEELIQLTSAGTRDALYAAELEGDLKRIRVMNVHQLTSYQIEAILRKVKPGLIVIDMLDNVKFSAGAINGGERSDETLEGGYQWARMLAVQYDCPIIATSQTTGPAAGLQYPPDTMLKGSTTGKQGAAEQIIMMGAVDEYPHSRFISIPKMKVHRPGAPVYPRFEVLFDGERGRLLMPQEEK